MYPSRLTTRLVSRGAPLAVALFVCASTVSAQTPQPSPQQPQTTTELVSLGQSLTDLAFIATGKTNVGDSLRLLSSIEVAGTPMGSSAGGFAFKLDKTTGLEARTATTFGPAFAERAITSGAGNMSVSLSLAAATYDKLDDQDLLALPLSSQTASNPSILQNSRRGTLSLVLDSQTTVVQTVMGATDNLDVGASIPIVRVRLNAISFVQDDAGNVLIRGEANGISSGLGDVGLMAKYRFFRFGGTPPPDAPIEPDPGGLALIGTARLPTGSVENLRGLGVTRVLGGLVFSSGRGRFRPHANIGYEWWSKGIDVRNPVTNGIVTARNHVQFSAGVELEAAPRLTLIADFVSRQILGAGRIGSETDTNPGIPGASSVTYPVTLPEGTLEQSIVPGLKWNVRGKILLVLSGIIAVRDNGLYDKFTPVVGIDITF